MKKSGIICTLLLSALLFTPPSQAQTSNAPPGNPFTTNSLAAAPIGTAQSFLEGAWSYLSSFNPSNAPCMESNSWRLYSGFEYLQSVNEAAVLGAEGRPFSKVKWLTLGEASAFAGVAGTVAQQELTLGYSCNYLDTEFTFGVAGVDVFNANVGFGKGVRAGPFTEIKKATGAHTFLGLKIEDTWGKGKGQQPPVTVFAGFTF